MTIASIHIPLGTFKHGRSSVSADSAVYMENIQNPDKDTNINDGEILIQYHVSMHNTDTPLDQSHNIARSSDKQPTQKDVPPTTGGKEKHVSTIPAHCPLSHYHSRQMNQQST